MPFDKEEQQPSFDEKPEEAEDEQDEQEPIPNITVLSRVGTFFGWLGELINEQARVDAQEKAIDPPLHIIHEIKLRQQKTSEVIDNAKIICKHLEEIKERLSLEFGSSAGAFISKCIDPMILHANELICALEEPPAGNGDTLQNLLEQAIESVELYSQFSDESKLKRKIVQVAQSFIKQTIDKDLEVLANYKHHAFEICSFSTEEKQTKEFQLDRHLYPIVSELMGMSESRLETDDLHAFLVWKTSVDDRRNSLLELGFLTIDAMLGGNEVATTIATNEDEGVVLEQPFGELLKQQLEENSLAMSFLSTLEDRASDIFERIEGNAFTDKDSLDTVQQLLEYLKLDAERFEAISAHTKNVIDSFHRLREDLLKVETLLQSKKIL